MSSRFAPLCLLALLFAGLPTVAMAQDDDRAFELFNNGRDLYNEGRYKQAVVAFEEAYKLSQRYELYLNIANAHERDGNLEAALEALARYQVYATADEKSEVERRKLSLEKRLETERATKPEPEPEPAPAPQPVAPAPAPAPQPKPGPKNTDGGGGGGGRVVLGAAVMGVGVAAAGTGVAMGLVSSGAKKRALLNCTELDGERLCSGAAGKDLGTHQTTALIADIGFAVGVAAVTTGVVLIVTKPRSSKITALSVGPSRVQLSGTF